MSRWLQSHGYCYDCGAHDIQDCICAEFADPGGNSALRAGVRDKPCPTCKEPNRLTQKDVDLGYQCDPCADRAERGGDY